MSPSDSFMPWQPHVLKNIKISEVTKWFGIMEGLQEGVIIQDATTKVVAINKAASKLLGIKPQDILGHDSRDIDKLGLVSSNGKPYPPGEDPSYTTMVTGRGMAAEFLGVTFEDGPHWFIANFMPIWEEGEMDDIADGVIVSFHAAPHNKFVIDHSLALDALAGRLMAEASGAAGTDGTSTGGAGAGTAGTGAAAGTGSGAAGSGADGSGAAGDAAAGADGSGPAGDAAGAAGTGTAAGSSGDTANGGTPVESHGRSTGDTIAALLNQANLPPSKAGLPTSFDSQILAPLGFAQRTDLPAEINQILTNKTDRSRAKVYEEAFQLSTNGNLLIQIDGSISAINNRLADLVGRSKEQLLGVDWRTIVRPEDQHVVANYLRNLDSSQNRPIFIRLFHDKGRAIYTKTLGFRIDNPDPQISSEYYLTFEQVQGRFSNSGMPAVETHDPLTGLPNQEFIINRISQSLHMAQRRETKVALLHVDIDRFVRINNSLGQDAGDQLLKQVGKRIQSTIRSHDTAGRLRGDEFVVISEDLAETADAMRLANRISETMRQPFEINDESVTISTSIGVAFAENNDVPTQLLRRADMAMHEAKDIGRDTVSLYNADLKDQAVQRLNMENEIRVAIPAGQMRLHHQPIIRLDNKQVVGTEALIRWQHPTRGLLTPYHFLGIAEESDLIVDVGKWVIKEASEQAYRFNANRGLHTAVNVSAKQLAEPDFVELVQQTLEAAKLPAEQLILELTETSLLQASPKTFQDIETLTDYGIRLAIDDFGTGYSSLTYLDRLPVSVVKIDRSFVKEMVADKRRRAIAQAVIQLGMALNLEVIAEGIEEQAQSDLLESMGCNFAQGYLFGRPAPLESSGA